jgi:CubicO group peptidase (beta-lactamase class C family)
LFKPLGMKDTTFWPNEEQVARLAKAYTPAPNGMGLAEIMIEQLHYPLTEHEVRYPMPGGGLFSTAADVARLYQMLASGGELDGRRYLSQAAIDKMTSKRTPDDVKDQYGFGFQVSSGQYGHGGAYSTNTYFDRNRKVILIWLVQHNGFPVTSLRSCSSAASSMVSAPMTTPSTTWQPIRRCKRIDSTPRS